MNRFGIFEDGLNLYQCLEVELSDLSKPIKARQFANDIYNKALSCRRLSSEGFVFALSVVNKITEQDRAYNLENLCQ